MGNGGRVVLALVLCLLSVFFSASETAFLSAARTGLWKEREKGDGSRRTALALINRPARLIASIIAGITVSSYLAETLLTTVAYRWSHQIGIGWLGPVLSFLTVLFLLIFIDVTPALYGTVRGASFALISARLVALGQKLFMPFLWISERTVDAIFWAIGLGSAKSPPLITEGEILAYLERATKDGIIGEEERAMVASALEFKDIRVAEAMVPRVDMVAIRADIPVEEAADVIVRSGHARLPVYRDTRDEIVGILHAKDVLGALFRGEKVRTAGELARPPLYATEPQRAYHLLRAMQRQRKGMAIVLDEEGGTAGLVTVEDLLEEIVGEVYDEYDVTVTQIQPAGDGGYLVSASASIRQIEKSLGIELPEEEYDNLAELLLDRLEKVPSVGDRVEVDGIGLEVAEMRGRRISKVRITVPRGDPTGD